MVEANAHSRAELRILGDRLAGFRGVRGNGSGNPRMKRVSIEGTQ